MKPTDFLQRFMPDEIWTLTAITVAQDKVDTEAFPPGPDRIDLVDEWVDDRNGKLNLYWHACSPIKAKNKKIGTDECRCTRSFHVDVDAPGSASHEAMAELNSRIDQAVQDGSIPPPSVRLMTGGGQQLLWILDQPIPIHGSVITAREVGRYNKRLAQILGGDACHDPVHLLRLPGTTNLPTEAKAARGRVPVEAEVLSFTDAVYNLADFSQATEGLSADLADVQLTDEVQTFGLADKIAVPGATEEEAATFRELVIHGRLVDNPHESGDDSGSAWDFHLCCLGVRYEVDPQVIFSLLIGGEFSIGKHVRSQKNPKRTARKFINDARRNTDFTNADTELERMNQRFAVIGNMGGKCLVVEEVHDPILNRTRLIAQPRGEFIARMHRTRIPVLDKVGERKYLPAGKWWLDQIEGRQYDRLVLAPKMDVPDAYNLWRGLRPEAQPGQLHRRFVEDHIFENIADADQAVFDYIIGWLAASVQRPAEPGYSAIVMRGPQGTGKSFFAKAWGYLFDRHFLHVTNASHLTGNFNAHLRDAVALFADEAFYAGDKKHESVLKTLITEESLTVEVKGRDVEQCPNFIHLMMASNSEWVVPVGFRDRRFLITDINTRRERDTAYFGKLAEELGSGGYAHLHRFLLDVDLSNYNSQRLPGTSAKDDHREQNLTVLERLIRDALTDGTCPWMEDADHDLHGRPCFKSSDVSLYLQRARHADVDSLAVGKLLGATGLNWPKTTMNGGNTRWLRPGDIAEAQTAFDQVVGTRVAWPDGVAWVDAPPGNV